LKLLTYFNQLKSFAMVDQLGCKSSIATRFKDGTPGAALTIVRFVGRVHMFKGITPSTTKQIQITQYLMSLCCMPVQSSFFFWLIPTDTRMLSSSVVTV
jgi:hypothetical protein